MFFERRRWAVRIVERVCAKIRSQEAVLLRDMIISASKHTPVRMPRREATIMAAVGLAANQSAVARMAEELVVSPAVAQHFLDRLHRAALAVAGENGMQPVEHAAGRRGARAHAGATLLAARVGEGDDKKAA